MTDQPRKFSALVQGQMSDWGSGVVQRVGVVDGAIGGAERLASIAALFPNVSFEPLGSAWPERTPPGLNLAIVAAAASDFEAALARLAAPGQTARFVVVLRDADVTSTRMLMRAGAADVLPAPVSEPALALALERLLTADEGIAPSRKGGEVVALIKAGGGVGATALGVQMAAHLAGRRGPEVCFADLDLQFGAGAVYFDLPDAVTLTDCLSSGSNLAETPFANALATHRSGARLLAAPREVVALETLDAVRVDALLTGLRRSFGLTLVDLPSVWTSWTSEVVHRADRIVLVTNLSVPHIQLVKRQLRVLAAQRLDDRPVILVCNAQSPEQAAVVSLKAAERAMGRAFDVVLPEDRKTMHAAINQGVDLASVRRGTKLERAIGDLADKVAVIAPAPAAVSAPRRGWR
jgi:pilus assembly protein CpaE